MGDAPNSRLSVLLVEDNPADARLVRELLKDASPHVVLTHVGRLHEAMQHLRSQEVSVILLDLSLPDSQGFDTFARARAEAPGAPIVVLTGLSDEDVAARAVREGAQDYLVKGQVNGHVLYQSLRFAVQRHAAMEALQRSEAKYRSLIEGSIQGILIHIDGVVQLVNQALVRLLGYDNADEIVGKRVWEFLAPEDRNRVADYVHARTAGLPAPQQYQQRALRRDGSVILLQTFVTAVKWNDHRATLATFIDVTEQTHAQEELRVSEERFQQLAENIKEALIVVDLPSFKSVYLSRMWSEIWGQPLEDEYRHPGRWFESIHHEDRGHVQTGQQAVLRGEPATSVFRLIRPDASLRWVRSRIFPVFNDQREVYRMVGLLEDITEVHETEEQLRQAQKMEAVGRLAGGVAHDFNNLLTAILGFGELALDELGTNPAAADVREMVGAARSAEHLTRQLLAFSRRQILQSQNLLLNDVVRRTESLLRRVIGEDVALHLTLAEPLGLVYVDPGQIEQVLMNLAVNARDAMPDGGHLTIETANVLLDEDYVSRHAGATAGPHTMIAMSDTGMGIDPAIRDRIFEPFFTTKEMGKGTGLGLATVYGIVKQSRGSVWLYSEVGVGTTFKIYLPVVQTSADRTATHHPEPASIRGTETVLVVEDQVETRSVICKMLSRHGYQVLDAMNGADALEKVKTYQGPIHVLLTDVVMPGMGGRQVAEQLSAVRPRLRVIFMSGYTDDAILRHGILDAGLAFLQKPFTTEALLGKIRQVLDTPPDSGSRSEGA